MVAASSRVGRLSAFCSWFSARAGWRSACVDRGCHSCPRILYSLLFHDITCNDAENRHSQRKHARIDRPRAPGAERSPAPHATDVPCAPRSAALSRAPYSTKRTFVCLSLSPGGAHPLALRSSHIVRAHLPNRSHCVRPDARPDEKEHKTGRSDLLLRVSCPHVEVPGI